MAKRLWLLLFTLFVGLALSACSQVDFNVEDLMYAPVLAPEQAAIKNALLEGIGVGESGVQFKYPKAGNYRSAFVMRDLDGDGKDEALVFYNLVGAEETNVFVSVLSQDQSGWRINYRTGGSGTAVDFVTFCNITDQQQENLVIAWTGPGEGERTVTVYDYQPDNLEEMLREVSTSSYTELLIHDFNKDGLFDLLLLSSNAVTRKASALVSMANGQGDLKKSRPIGLSSSITSFAKVQVGMLDTGLEAIFIDANQTSRTITTNILMYDPSQPANYPLVDILQRMPEEEQVSFSRQQKVFCEDVDQDGYIDIPRLTVLPGYTEEDETAMYATEYLRYRAGTLEQAWYGVVNLADGYRFHFPPDWVGSVSVSRQGSTDELYFFAFQGDLKNDARDLLRLRTNRPNRPEDKFNTLHYQSLDGSKGIYDVYVPALQDEPLSLTFAQVAERFTILNQGLLYSSFT